MNHLRSAGRRSDGQLLSTEFDVASEHTGLLTNLVREEDGASLGELMQKLSEAQREVLVMRYFEGLKREEIADVLELDVSVVKSRLFEGFNRLRKLAE